MTALAALISVLLAVFAPAGSALSSERWNRHDLRPIADRPDRDWAFQYDGLHRLTDASRGVLTNADPADDQAPGSRRWDLDELGNWNKVETWQSGGPWAAETRVHNATNEITRIGSADRTYDDNGNLRSANNRWYEYDAWNRLVRVRSGSSSGAVVAEYDYNALHWRVAKRSQDPAASAYVQRLMYYSPSWQLLFEDIDDDVTLNGAYDATGHTTTRTGLQAWGKRGLDDALYRRVTHTDPAAVRDFFYLTDSQFSVRALIGSGGRARPYETLRYDAYGTPTHRYPEDLDDNGTLNIFDVTAFLAHHTASDMRADLDYNGLINFFDTQIPTWALSYKTSLPPGALSDWGAEGPDNRIGYAGYVWDHEIGMWLGRHRVYDPGAGRWMQRDPAGYVDGLSMYLFVRGNPLSLIDPMGLCASPEWHHLIPQHLREGMEKLQINIDDAEMGWLLSKADHAKLEAAGWWKEWGAWSDSFEDGKYTAKDVAEQLYGMLNPENKKYANILKRGGQATVNYNKWGNFNGVQKNAHYRSAVMSTKNALEAIQGNAKTKWAATVAGRALKKSPVLAVIAFSSGVLAGEPATVALFNTVSPLSTNDVADIHYTIDTHIDSLYQGVWDGAARKMRNYYAENGDMETARSITEIYLNRGGAE